jgi:hypothetical protein
MRARTARLAGIETPQVQNAHIWNDVAMKPQFAEAAPNGGYRTSTVLDDGNGE